jgi:transcriptional regulator with XRE-family HTH domain
VQNIVDILSEIKRRRYNVAEIERKTGIPYSRISKWLEGKGKPKADDHIKMIAWANKYLLSRSEGGNWFCPGVG